MKTTTNSQVHVITENKTKKKLKLIRNENTHTHQNLWNIATLSILPKYCSHAEQSLL